MVFAYYKSIFILNNINYPIRFLARKIQQALSNILYQAPILIYVSVGPVNIINYFPIRTLYLCLIS
jgi:hypothetical protein